MALPAMKFEEKPMDEHDRLLVLERDVAHIDKNLSEVKAEMKSGFEKIDIKFEKVDVKFDALNKKVDELKDSTNNKFDELKGSTNKKIDELRDSTNESFKGVNQKFLEVNQKFIEMNKAIFDSKDELKGELKKDLKWTVGIFGGGVVALAALMYFLFSRIPMPAAETKAVSALSAPASASMPGSAIPVDQPVSAAKQQAKKGVGQ